VKRARFTPAAVIELEDAARRVDRARPGWGDKLNDEVLDAIDRIEEYVEGWQTFDDAEIQITAVVYGGREPVYWRKRR
jgi:hypothetical protein